MKNQLRGVYFITDTSIQHRYTHGQLTEMALQGGASIVQFRDKKLEARESLIQVDLVAKICDEHGAVSVVNDRIDLALAAGASGVHLGQNDLPLQTARRLLGTGKIIGGTSSTLHEAQQVEAQEADYVAMGHIFETTTKTKNYAPRGVDYLHEVCEAISIPVIAIGGISQDNAAEVIEAGADMIAVSSAVCCADEPVKATRKLVSLFP